MLKYQLKLIDTMYRFFLNNIKIDLFIFVRSKAFPCQRSHALLGLTFQINHSATEKFYKFEK